MQNGAPYELGVQKQLSKFEAFSNNCCNPSRRVNPVCAEQRAGSAAVPFSVAKYFQGLAEFSSNQFKVKTRSMTDMVKMKFLETFEFHNFEK